MTAHSGNTAATLLNRFTDYSGPLAVRGVPTSSNALTFCGPAASGCDNRYFIVRAGEN
jgi:hypothetical protein